MLSGWVAPTTQLESQGSVYSPVSFFQDQMFVEPYWTLVQVNTDHRFSSEQSKTILLTSIINVISPLCIMQDFWAGVYLVTVVQDFWAGVYLATVNLTWNCTIWLPCFLRNGFLALPYEQHASTLPFSTLSPNHLGEYCTTSHWAGPPFRVYSEFQIIHLKTLHQHWP